MKPIVLIGDIRRSRALLDRAGAQRRLNGVCADLNRRAEALSLLSPLTVTLGDEFQAVFGSAASLWQVVFAVEAALLGEPDGEEGLSLRFGIGIGELATPINRQAAIGMDGPAFHRARDAIDSLKKDDRCYRVVGLGKGQSLVRHALDYISHQRQGWRENRVRVFSNLLAGISVADSASGIGISDRAVYKNIRHGDLESLAGFLRGLAEMIDAEREGAV